MITRKAILIFNDGGPDNYLPGVKLDRANYLGFLKSPEGGAWEDNEIMVYDNNCTRATLQTYIDTYRRAEGVGYWLIIFSGHGYTNDNDQTILELSPGDDCLVQDIKNATDYSRRLLIADSCRTVIHAITDSLKRERRLFSTIARHDEYRDRCRALYMTQLEGVYGNTFNVVYATANNQAANDDDTTGGYYTFELLHAAQACIEGAKATNRDNDYVASIERIHTIAAEAVNSKTNGGQTPSAEGHFLRWIPFVVVPRI